MIPRPRITLYIHGHGTERTDLKKMSSISNTFVSQLSVLGTSLLTCLLNADEQVDGFRSIYNSYETIAEGNQELLRISMEGRPDFKDFYSKFGSTKFKEYHNSLLDQPLVIRSYIHDKIFSFEEHEAIMILKELTYGIYVIKTYDSVPIPDSPKLNLIEFSDFNSFLDLFNKDQAESIRKTKFYESFSLKTRLASISLSLLLEIMKTLGFIHVNIIDYTCRAVKDEIGVNENLSEKTQSLLRSISILEKEQAELYQDYGKKTKRRKKRSIRRKKRST